MPFVNIRLIEGRSQQRKDEISKRVTDAISEVLQLPKDDVWVVFEDCPGGGLVCWQHDGRRTPQENAGISFG